MPDIGDWTFIGNIGARRSEKPFEPIAILSNTNAALRRGEAISLAAVPKEWKELPIFLDEQSLPFVFYISDQFFVRRYWRALSRQYRRREYKFHFKWCRTLEEMKNRTGVIDTGLNTTFATHPLKSMMARPKKDLKVCLNCCNEHQDVYKFFKAYGKDIEDKFRMPEFFEEFGKIDLPLPHHPGGRDDYSRDWPKVAYRKKEKARWRCQDCQHYFVENKEELHVHHINGVKSNNVSDNLEVVCRSCHSKKPGHEHMRA